MHIDRMSERAACGFTAALVALMTRGETPWLAALALAVLATIVVMLLLAFIEYADAIKRDERHADVDELVDAIRAGKHAVDTGTNDAIGKARPAP